MCAIHAPVESVCTLNELDVSNLRNWQTSSLKMLEFELEEGK